MEVAAVYKGPNLDRSPDRKYTVVNMDSDNFIFKKVNIKKYNDNNSNA